LPDEEKDDGDELPPSKGKKLEYHASVDGKILGASGKDKDDKKKKDEDKD